MEEISVPVNKQQTLTSPPPSFSSGDSLQDPLPLPILPLDLILEILCRLPVKPLLQLRCVSKSWNSFISDRKFANTHLCLSTLHHIHRISYCTFSCNYIHTSYPLHSFFTGCETTDVTELIYPFNKFYKPYIIGSCNGILCIAYHNHSILLWSILLWNPSIKKFKELPHFQKLGGITNLTVSFGYDSVTDNYKVVVVLQYTDVQVHTLGTDFWKSIQEFPFGVMPVERSGKFASGRINWLASTDLSLQSPRCIVSIDLQKETYEKVLPPDGVDACNFSLSVLRDCLCIIAGIDIWVMKEYGIQESWIKLFTVFNIPDPINSCILTKAAYIFEDDQVLLEFVGDLDWNLVIYDSENGTFRFPIFQNIDIAQEVSVESLISPSF